MLHDTLSRARAAVRRAHYITDILLSCHARRLQAALAVLAAAHAYTDKQALCTEHIAQDTLSNPNLLVCLLDVDLACTHGQAQLFVVARVAQVVQLPADFESRYKSKVT
jgi:hypothetical protein